MKHDEETLQQNCVTWARLQYPHEAALLHHSPNGGKRNIREAARFKAMGTRAGFPDLLLLVPSKGWHALAVEMKTATGRLSSEQKQWRDMLTANGYRYEVARSFDDFRRIMADYLNENSETAI